MIVQCPGCQQYYDVNDNVSSCPLCGIQLDTDSAEKTAGQPPVSRFPGWINNDFVRLACAIFGVLAVIAVLFVGYLLFFRGGNALDYVPEDAEFVVYGNTDMLLDSKCWKFAEKGRDFRRFVREFREGLGFDDIDDLRGTVAVWGKVPDGPFAAVIVLDDANAAELYELLLDKAKGRQYREVDEKDMDGCESFTVFYNYSSSDDEDVEFSVVLIDDFTLQLVFGDETDEIFEDDSDNEMAQAIDRDAIFAAAGSSDLWDFVDDVLRRQGLRDVDTGELGVFKVEVFADNSNIRIVLDGDISDMEAD